MKYLLLVACIILACNAMSVTESTTLNALVSERPQSPDFCKAQFPFCPGQTAFPAWEQADEIDVYLLQAPVWEFKFGNLMGKLNGWHDAMGLVNKRTGQNYTLEWYELFQLGNCTFPHLVPSASDPKTLEPLWCNQGAACLTKSIDDKHWSENGTMVQVSTINGNQFKDFIDWVHTDNSTRIIYETFNVLDKPHGKSYFESFDCADFVIRALRKMVSLGGTAVSGVHKFTRVELYTSKAPELIDPVEHADDLVSFYKHFQKNAIDSKWHIVETIFHVAVENILFGKFYVYMNGQYYRLHLHWPFVNTRYEEVVI